MNNSQTTIENEPDERLTSEEAKTVRIIEALRDVQQSKGWNVLKETVFDRVASVLEKDIRSEVMSENLDPMKLNRLSGELKWAERYSDLSKLENHYKIQLNNIRLKLYGKKD